MGAFGQVALLAAGYPVTAVVLHGGETSHIQAGAKGPALARQYYRPNPFFMSKPPRGGHQRVKHGGIERVHLVRPHQPDIGDTVRNRYRDALLHENFPPQLFFVAALQKGRCPLLVNRPINNNSFGWKRCSTISFSPGGAFS
jgi:hypothetical protein